MPIPKAFASYFPLPPTRFLCHQLSLCLLRSPLPTSHEAVFFGVKLFWTRISRMGERLRDKKTKRQKDKKRKKGRVEERKRGKDKERKRQKPLAINSNKPFLERNACRLLHHQDRVRLRRCGSRRHLRGRTALQADTE